MIIKTKIEMKLENEERRALEMTKSILMEFYRELVDNEKFEELARDADHATDTIADILDLAF